MSTVDEAKERLEVEKHGAEWMEIRIQSTLKVVDALEEVAKRLEILGLTRQAAVSMALQFITEGSVNSDAFKPEASSGAPTPVRGRHVA